MYQVGLVFQGGFVTLCVNASVEIGTCDIAMSTLTGSIIGRSDATGIYVSIGT